MLRSIQCQQVIYTKPYFFSLGRRLLFEANLNAINLWKVEWNEVQRNVHNTAMVSDGQMLSPLEVTFHGSGRCHCSTKVHQSPLPLSCVIL